MSKVIASGVSSKLTSTEKQSVRDNIGLGTAAAANVTTSAADTVIGRLLKVEDRYFTINFSVTLPEDVTRRYMSIELPSISRSLFIKVSAIAHQGQQIGTGGFDAVYTVGRYNALEVSTLYCSEKTGGSRIGLAAPIIEGNIVHFGLRRGNNGTTTNANVTFKVEVLCQNRSDFNLTYSDGSISHVFTEHSNKVLHTGNTGSIVTEDYEEGTWTPVIVGSATAGTATYTVQAGSYVKTGRSVVATCYLTWTGSSGTGEMQIAGLPFLQSAVGNVYQSASVGYASNLVYGSGDLGAHGIHGTDRLKLNTRSSGALRSYPSVSANGAIMITFNYITN
jgi:hypothetical protein